MAGSTAESSSSSSSAQISQGFHPNLDPLALRRSLIMSAAASAIGAVFFTVIQGTIFNFFLEDLSLRDRLPYFMALWCFGNIGTLMGSWIQERYNCRRSLFFVTVGGSRLIWLVIGLIPIFRPEWMAKGPAFTWLTVLTISFYFIHSLGGNAWISWMADLVPTHLQGRYWSLRQVACSLTGILSRLAFGYYLESHRNMNGYAVIFCCATIFGVADAAMFYWVEHRRPVLRHERRHLFTEFMRRMSETPFRRLIGVYLLWSISNCIMGPTCFYFMRDRVGMDVTDISVAEATSLLSFTIFSLLWGKFSDQHGHRGPLVTCLLIQALCPLFYFFAHRGDSHLVALAMSMGAIGFCGINLFMFPMLISFTKGKGGGREVGMAAFTMMMGLSNFAALIVTDRWLYDFVGSLVGSLPKSTPVYMAIMVLAMLLRTSAAALAWILPEKKEDTAPGVVIAQIITTNPLRATLSMFRYVTGQEEWSDGRAPLSQTLSETTGASSKSGNNSDVAQASSLHESEMPGKGK